MCMKAVHGSKAIKSPDDTYPDSKKLKPDYTHQVS